MMRAGTGIALFLGLACSGPAPVEDERSGGPLAMVDAPMEQPPVELGAAYAAYAADTASAAKQRAYFDAFPSDFAGLKKAFGFEEINPDSIVVAPYYEQGDDMIGAFFRLDQVPVSTMAAKAVGIASHGVWQEDGVNYFLHHLTERLERDPTTFLAAITSLPSSQQIGFWSFYLDGAEGYRKEDSVRLHAMLSKETRHLAIIDSLLASSRPKH